MKKIFLSLLTFFGFSHADVSSFALDYEKAIGLDAEALAELGIKERYEEIRMHLRNYIDKTADIQEKIDGDAPSYSIIYHNETYVIFSPLQDDQTHSWERATYTLFHIINDQLKDHDVKFYALYGGNKLEGIFLTDEEYQKAKKALREKSEHPYLPSNELAQYNPRKKEK